MEVEGLTLPQSLIPLHFAHLSDSLSSFSPSSPSPFPLILCLDLLDLEESLPQRGPGRLARFLGGTLTMVFIHVAALAVFLYHLQKKSWLDMHGGR